MRLQRLQICPYKPIIHLWWTQKHKRRKSSKLVKIINLCLPLCYKLCQYHMVIWKKEYWTVIYKIYLPHLKRCYSPYITFLRNVYVVYILKKTRVGRVCKSNLRRARFGCTTKTFFCIIKMQECFRSLDDYITW